MGRLHALLTVGVGVWCVAILLPALTSVDSIRLFFALICHQMPERSFWLHGEPLAVCVRCSGFYFGFLAALLSGWIFRIPSNRLSIQVASCMVLLDILNGFLPLYPELALFRFVTAFSFSIAAAPFLLQGLKEAINCIRAEG